MGTVCLQTLADRLEQYPLPSMSPAEAQRALKRMLVQIKASNASLSADCTSTLGVEDLEGANALLLPVFNHCKTLLPTNERPSVKWQRQWFFCATRGSASCC